MSELFKHFISHFIPSGDESSLYFRKSDLYYDSICEYLDSIPHNNDSRGEYIDRNLKIYKVMKFSNIKAAATFFKEHDINRFNETTVNYYDNFDMLLVFIENVNYMREHKRLNSLSFFHYYPTVVSFHHNVHVCSPVYAIMSSEPSSENIDDYMLDISNVDESVPCVITMMRNNYPHSNPYITTPLNISNDCKTVGTFNAFQNNKHAMKKIIRAGPIDVFSDYVINITHNNGRIIYDQLRLESMEICSGEYAFKQYFNLFFRPGSYTYIKNKQTGTIDAIIINNGVINIAMIHNLEFDLPVIYFDYVILCVSSIPNIFEHNKSNDTFKHRVRLFKGKIPLEYQGYTLNTINIMRNQSKYEYDELHRLQLPTLSDVIQSCPKTSDENMTVEENGLFINGSGKGYEFDIHMCNVFLHNNSLRYATIADNTGYSRCLNVCEILSKPHNINFVLYTKP